MWKNNKWKNKILFVYTYVFVLYVSIWVNIGIKSLIRIHEHMFVWVFRLVDRKVHG